MATRLSNLAEAPGPISLGPPVGGIDVINTATDTVTATIPTSNQPDGIAFTADGTATYVANYVGSSVSVINTATSTVTATIASPTAETPTSVALTPDGTYAYVADYNSNNVSVISTATNTIVATIGGLSGPDGVSITPDGADVYVTNENNNTVSVISTATNTVTDTIAAGSVPDGIVADPTGGAAYVANISGNNVSVISTSTNAITDTIAVGSLPFEVAMAPALPAVTAVSSSSGPVAGGSTVTITGTQLAGTSAVDFGSIPAANVTVINGLTVTATVPSQDAGTVDVTVTTPAGTSATSSADRYAYFAPYPFTGYLFPVKNPPAVNPFIAGLPVPLGFSLGSNQGLEHPGGRIADLTAGQLRQRCPHRHRSARHDSLEHRSDLPQGQRHLLVQLADQAFLARHLPRLHHETQRLHHPQRRIPLPYLKPGPLPSVADTS